jgi:hypothetical protein
MVYLFIIIIITIITVFSKFSLILLLFSLLIFLINCNLAPCYCADYNLSYDYLIEVDEFALESWEKKLQVLC